MEGIKIFQRNNNKKKTKIEKMVVNNIKIFLKKKKVKGVSMDVIATKVSLKIKNKVITTFCIDEYIKPFFNLWISPYNKEFSLV